MTTCKLLSSNETICACGSFFFIFGRHHFDAVEFSTATAGTAREGTRARIFFLAFPKAPGYHPRLAVPRTSLSAQVKLSGSIETSPRASPDNSQGWELTVVRRRDPEYDGTSSSLKRVSLRILPARARLPRNVKHSRWRTRRSRTWSIRGYRFIQLFPFRDPKDSPTRISASTFNSSPRGQRVGKIYIKSS